jgi:prephenate dehydratase
MKEGIVFLGPLGATFSADAYNVLARKFGAPKLDSSATYQSVKANSDIIPTLVGLGFNYGVIAMETMAQGKVVEPVESFMDLMDYSQDTCPVSVIGAIKMEIHFALMTKPGVLLKNVQKVLCHEKTLGACRKGIEKAGFAVETRSSNGLAALEVYSSKETNLAALGPISAAEKYGLSVLNDKFEDGKAVTTFFLLGSEELKPKILECNRAMIIFRTKHCVGSLVDALISFKDENLSLIHIHSAYAGKTEYNFAIEIELRKNQLSNFNRAMKKFRLAVSRCLVFGPFGLVL